MNHGVDGHSSNRVEWSEDEQRRNQTEPVDRLVSAYHNEALRKNKDQAREHINLKTSVVCRLTG